MKEYLLRPAPGPFRIDYAKELNPEQLDVVMAGDGALLVIAGAGSGKTRTLTYRVARLIESGVQPSQILLLTFTNKAAREMLRRVEGLLGMEHGSVTGGTFHHVGNLVLRRHAPLVGLQHNFTILDRDDAADLMADIITGLKLRADNATFPKADVILELLSYSTNTGVAVEKLITTRYFQHWENKDSIIRCCNAYRHRKQTVNAVDFDDLLVLWRDLLVKNPEIREAQHARWRYVLVDEYQDTNRLQSEIVETIAGPDGNLMVVGDDAQSIYSWRGAHFANILEFPKRYPAARQFKLEINYRSTPQILALSNDSIAHNVKQFRKSLKAVRPDSGKPELVTCGTVHEQAQFVAQRIQDLAAEEDEPFREIAVLYRAHWHSMELQMEMTRRNIPFVVRSGLRFFEQAHVKDVCSYLRLVVNPRDEMAWRRAVKLYPRIGDGVAAKIWAAIENDPEPLNAILREPVLKAVPKGAQAGWRNFTKLVLALDKLKSTPAEMVRVVLQSGYNEYLTATWPDALQRADDVNRLADYAMRYSSAEDLLSELALTINVAGRDQVGTELEEVVVLTTVHQAKGLEWNSVFVLWLTETKFPDARAVKDSQESGGEEEERRLFYVACTRAKDRLMLVYPTLADERNLRSVIQRPSRFVEELGAGVFDEVTVGYERRDEPRMLPGRHESHLWDDQGEPLWDQEPPPGDHVDF